MQWRISLNVHAWHIQLPKCTSQHSPLSLSSTHSLISHSAHSPSHMFYPSSFSFVLSRCTRYCVLLSSLRCCYVCMRCTCLDLRAVVEVEVECGVGHRTDVTGDRPVQHVVQHVIVQVIHAGERQTTTSSRQTGKVGTGQMEGGVRLRRRSERVRGRCEGQGRKRGQ